MNVWFALLRGINVGGKNVLMTEELVALLERVGCSNVKPTFRVAMSSSRVQNQTAWRWGR